MDAIAKEIIEHELGKCPWAIFTSTDPYFQFYCKFSNIEGYLTDREYAIYQLTSLERFLAKKNQSLGPLGLKEFYEKEEQQILSYVIDWSTKTKIVILIQVNNPFLNSEQIQQALDTLGKNRKRISEAFESQRSPSDG